METRLRRGLEGVWDSHQCVSRYLKRLPDRCRHALPRQPGRSARELERAQYTYATDQKALEAFQTLNILEGILPALESAHAVAEAIKRAPSMSPESIIIVNLSGRGDKDLDTVTQVLDLN